ncbi:unnamed protein product [Phyllotreta striolata]|uniref:Uncharacterized protein n=1 Tax=Phyllotreta striolata TaxID=444603 RepID=A0A9N9TS09_PHYSR|nr:unnamed protein product [Phyllotreta striolata]
MIPFRKFVLASLVYFILVSSGAYSDCVRNGNSLVCNNLGQISGRIFDDSYRNITDIKVDNKNEHTDLLNNAFIKMPHLTKISVVNSRIDSIYSTSIQNLTNLKQLWFSRDGITKIHQSAFTNLPSLEKIYLSHNELKSITKGILSNTTALKSIILSHNKISTIENEAFFDLPNLKMLALDHNELSTVFVHKLVSHPGVLELLWLHNNSLTLLTNYMLEKLGNLQTLNAGFNEISTVEANCFQHTPNLVTLVLTHNRLKELDGEVFPRSGMQLLRNLYLDNNLLMYLSSTFFIRAGGLKRATLMGNPWHCGCLEEIYRVFRENGIEEKCQGIFIDNQRPICVGGDVVNKHCSHVYSRELSEKYMNYMKRFPVPYVRGFRCVL